VTTSQQMSFLSEVLEQKPIPEDTLVYFRERMRDRLHSAILEAFLRRSAEKGLKQKDLADRIHRTRAQITRWFSTPTNLTLDSISDLMVGLGMDFDAFPFTPIEQTVTPEKQMVVTFADVGAPKLVDSDGGGFSIFHSARKTNDSKRIAERVLQWLKRGSLGASRFGFYEATRHGSIVSITPKPGTGTTPKTTAGIQKAPQGLAKLYRFPDNPRPKSVRSQSLLAMIGVAG